MTWNRIVNQQVTIGILVLTMLMGCDLASSKLDTVPYEPKCDREDLMSVLKQTSVTVEQCGTFRATEACLLFDEQVAVIQLSVEQCDLDDVTLALMSGFIDGLNLSKEPK
ncbi:hypothetical protein [Photobacterium lutimaris]|nr:hypothetical protein [Photobacterium lutimaris]TDR72649.1 hypothetical protein DFP78_113125 [Photobacterium lutimaris]